MVTFFSKYKISWRLSLGLVLASLSFSLLAMGKQPEKDTVNIVSVEQEKESTPPYHMFNCIYINQKFKTTKSQSLQYLAMKGKFDPKLVKDCNFTLIKKYEHGIAYDAKLLNNILETEIYLNKIDYDVFYHSQLQGFLLNYDLFKLFFKYRDGIILNDFIMMRNFNKTFKKNVNQYSNALTFLKGKEAIWSGGYSFDHFSEIRPFVVSVSSSFFEDTCCESAFYFFTSGSGSASSPDLFKFYEEIFKYFNAHVLFKKYKIKLQELYDLLNEKSLMLQIGIPKKYTKEIVYESYQYGIPVNTTPIATIKGEELCLDAQFRMCMLPQYFADPKNPYNIKIFTYCQENSNLIEYKKKFAEFADMLAIDLNMLFGEDFRSQGGDGDDPIAQILNSNLNEHKRTRKMNENNVNKKLKKNK